MVKLTGEQLKWILNEIIDDVSCFVKTDNEEYFVKSIKRAIPTTTDEQAKGAFKMYCGALQNVDEDNEKSFYEFYKKFSDHPWPEEFIQQCKDKFEKNYWVIESCDDMGFVKYHAFNKTEFPTVSDARKYFEENYTDERYNRYHDCTKEEMRHYARKSW